MKTIIKLINRKIRYAEKNLQYGNYCEGYIDGLKEIKQAIKEKLK